MGMARRGVITPLGLMLELNRRSACRELHRFSGGLAGGCARSSSICSEICPMTDEHAPPATLMMPKDVMGPDELEMKAYNFEIFKMTFCGSKSFRCKTRVFFLSLIP